jgi:hypothetical protein
MRSQRVEIQIQAIAGEDWDAPRRQSLPQVVNYRVCGILGACPKVKRRNNFGDWINGQP